MLFFGCQKRAEHFLYEEELLQYHSEGVISDLQLAFSRDGVPKKRKEKKEKRKRTKREKKKVGGC